MPQLRICSADPPCAESKSSRDYLVAGAKDWLVKGLVRGVSITTKPTPAETWQALHVRVRSRKRGVKRNDEVV
jgi:hypothetical protein